MNHQLVTPPAEPPIFAEATHVLPPFGHGVNNRRSLWEVLDSSASSTAGLSATTSYIGCPRYVELRNWLGVERKPTNAELEGAVELPAALFGVMMHALRSERLLYGPQAHYALLEYWRPELVIEDYLKALGIWQTYDAMFPWGRDPFEYLGVECEVRTPLKLWNGQWVLKTVRYDSVIRYPSDGSVYSFECKTSAKGGQGSLRPYLVQGMTHSGLWNANPWLVGKYGRMVGSLFDMLIKTKEPDCDRIPEYFSRYQQERALLFMCAPQQSVQFHRSPIDGKMPEMFGHCYGYWRPCEYVPLCHDQSYGSYQYRDGRDYDGR